MGDDVRRAHGCHPLRVKLRWEHENSLLAKV
jgi:hypothetical protein